MLRAARRQPPMGPRQRSAAPTGRVESSASDGTIVLSRGQGANVLDVDTNRYVDLAAGFGSLLLGHCPPAVSRALELQSSRLLQAMGDVYPSDAKIGLLDRLARLHPHPDAQVILGQSGADAITAAVKSALLATGRSRLIAMKSSYHGLSYGALAVTDLRQGYRRPFEAHLPDDVEFLSYPSRPEEAERCLDELRASLARSPAAAVVIEPILGRGGVIVPPIGFLPGLARIAQSHGTLIIADEIWTGLGRTGRWLACEREPTFRPDLLCIGKGLGGGLPISACLGSPDVMAAWSQEEEVVHTSTFAGAPLACAAALATLDALGRGKLIERSRDIGARWKERLVRLLEPKGVLRVRGEGLMLGIELPPSTGPALQRNLLRQGFITSLGGGQRDVLVLTPPLMIAEELLEVFDDALLFALSTLRVL